MNNVNKEIILISDYFNLYLIILFIIFIKPKLFYGYLLITYLLTIQERQIIEKRYQQQLVIIQTDYAAFGEDY